MIKHFIHIFPGVISSHPGYSEGQAYPNRFRRTDVITVEKGRLVEVSFTSFDVEFGSKDCYFDHLTVTDGDGTILINRLCGRVGGAAGYSPGYGYGYGNNSSEGNGNSSAVNGSVNGYGNISRTQGQAEDNNGNSSVNGSGNGNFSVNGNVSANGNVSEISLENILNKAIVSHTNVLIFTFATDGSFTGLGWSANWKSVTTGLHFTDIYTIYKFLYICRQ